MRLIGLAPLVVALATAHQVGDLVYRPNQTNCFDVSSADLSMSRNVSAEVEPTLRQRGFSSEEIDAAAEWAATDLRCGPERVPESRQLSRTALLARLRSVGRIIIESTPSGAQVEVDRQLWRDTTNTKIFATAGKRKIRVTLVGFSPVEKECEVRREGITRFSADLRQKGSKAQCERP